MAKPINFKVEGGPRPRPPKSLSKEMYYEARNRYVASNDPKDTLADWEKELMGYTYPQPKNPFAEFLSSDKCPDPDCGLCNPKPKCETCAPQIEDLAAQVEAEKKNVIDLTARLTKAEEEKGALDREADNLAAVYEKAVKERDLLAIERDYLLTARAWADDELLKAYERIEELESAA